MTATNHGLIGIALGAYLPLQYAIPIALVSHFVMDALPHYGIPQHDRNNSKIYQRVVAIDVVVALSFALLAAILGKWAMFWVGWIAYSPDFMWVFSYFKNKGDLRIQPQNAILKFHQAIQRYESPKGAYVELVLLAVLLPLTIHMLFR